MRTRYTPDRNGNLIVSVLPDPDFEEFNRAADVAQRTYEMDVRDHATGAVRGFAKPADDVPVDAAGHPIGNYL